MEFDKAMERWALLSYRRPGRVLACVVAVALLAGLLASRLVFHGSFVELLPADTQEVRDLEAVSQKAGGDGYLVLRARGAAPETLRRFAHALAPRLEALEEVRYTEFRYDTRFFKERALLLLSAEQLRGLREDLESVLEAEKLAANPLYVQLEDTPPPSLEEIARRHAPRAALSEYLTSPDGSELYLFVKPSGVAGDLVFAQRLLTRVQATSAEVARDFPGVQTDATGAHVLRLEEDRRMRQDLTRSSLLSCAIAALIVVLSCRRITALLVVGAPVGAGLLVTFAVAQQTVGYLNIITGFLVAILIGLGIEYGLHLAMRYSEERRQFPAGAALREAVLGTWKGALTSACTNAAAFSALMLAEFEAFAQFGWIAAVGVMLTVLATYLIGPALITLTERLRPARAEAPLPSSRPHREPRRMPRGALVGIVVGVGVLVAWSASVVGRIGFEPDMRKLRGEFAATKLDDRIIAQLGRRHSPTVFLTQDVAQAGQLAATLRELEARHGESRTFAEVVSLSDFLPRTGADIEAERAALRAFFDELPESARSSERLRPALSQLETMLNAKPFGVEELPTEVRRRFTALDGEGSFVLAFKRESLSDTDALHRFGDQMVELREVARARGLRFQVLDSNLIAYRIFDLVKLDGPWLLLAAGLAVFAMMVVSLRSLRRAGLVAGPLYLGLACLPAAMYAYGLKLNFINAVVLPNLLAIAVDNAVHLYHRYREEGPGSLPHVVRTTGVAAVVATLSNAAGYGALLTAGHPGLRSIGELALLGVACATLGTTVLFPAVLALLERNEPGAPQEQEEDALSLPFEVEADEETQRSV
ncbi:efflux RND transporter permease subunit [Archangium violaceum]|uniref:efflux RND transporter permease subunit n=1 Tax=Archangium violaceum TaxID=83451 RepID=UPI001EF01FFD|nr:MMPL family transporter [Archangium violaceum]